ncbi:hypothetical protein, partial [Stutzerimonas azotifigens]|uniref:hypothetical protein n=1 Tax=Stutzerimonas azotifigens TaxID=291995 RepID=UPI001F33F716
VETHKSIAPRSGLPQKQAVLHRTCGRRALAATSPAKPKPKPKPEPKPMHRSHAKKAVVEVG